MEALSRRLLTTLNIPVVSGLYGPLYTGSLILIEADLEASPNLLMASILAESVKKGWAGVILYRDNPPDYHLLFESIGIPVRKLTNIKRLEISEASNPHELFSKIKEMSSHLDTVLAYAVSLESLGETDTLDLLKALKGTNSVLYMMVDPQMLGQEILVLERLSDIVFRAKAVETDRGYARYLIMRYSKQRARPDIKVHYAVSSTGVSFEALTHM